METPTQPEPMPLAVPTDKNAPVVPPIPDDFQGNGPTVHPIPDASEDIVYTAHETTPWQPPVADPGSVMEAPIVKDGE